MKIPEATVKDFKKISFALAEDEILFENLKSQSLEEFWQNIDKIVQEKGIYRTIESDHIAFLLDRFDKILEQNIEIIKIYEKGEDNTNHSRSKQGINQKGLDQQNTQQSYSNQNQKGSSQKSTSNKQQIQVDMKDEKELFVKVFPITREEKEDADSIIFKVLQIESKLLKKDQYKFLYRQLDRILEILNWSDSLKIKRSALYILLQIVIIEDSPQKHELSYLKQSQLDQMSFFIRYYILHINSFNQGYTELSEIFKFDNQRYYKLELLYNPKYKNKNILDFEKAEQILKELDQQENINNDQNMYNVLIVHSQSQLKQEVEEAVDQDEKQESNWIELENKAAHFEFFENSINLKPLNSLSIKPILQKLAGEKLITYNLKYNDSMTLYQNTKKIFKDNSGKELDESICIFGGLKERLIILKNIKCIESRIEIAKIFLLSVQILSKQPFILFNQIDERFSFFIYIFERPELNKLSYFYNNNCNFKLNYNSDKNRQIRQNFDSQNYIFSQQNNYYLKKFIFLIFQQQILREKEFNKYIQKNTIKYLHTILYIGFLMKISKKHMQSIITDQQLAFEKFQKSFPKQVTDLIHLNLDPNLHADVIKFMLIIIKEQSQLRKTTEDYLSKYSDSLIYKIYTDCSNLELQSVIQNNQEMDIENESGKMIIENEDIRNRTYHPYRIISKGQTVQEITLLQSKFIDYALTFINTLLKFPDNQSQNFQEVTPFSMNFVQIPFRCEYLIYNLQQIREAIHSLSLMIQIEDIQREYKILFKIIDKIEYYLDQKPKFQWINGKWSPISQKQYDIFLGQLLRIINQIFETSSKRSRRITPQLAKQLTECPKFFIILCQCIDRIVKGYDEFESFIIESPDPTIVHDDNNKLLLIETVHLLSNINKENPNLIEKLFEEQIIQKTINALQILPLPTDTKSISQIIYFLYHISLKEKGRKEVMSSKLLSKIFDIFVDDSYAEEFYAYTLNVVIEAIQNYYQNIREIVDVIYEKLNDLLLCLKKKCITYTNQIEIYLNLANTTFQNQNEIDQSKIKFEYKNVLCYQIFNVCKLIEKLVTGIENQYPDSKNKFASESLLNYLEILQFPFLFLMPQRTTHKTPFFSVKTTCKAIYNKLNSTSMEDNNKINKLLDMNIQNIEDLLGKKIEDISNLNLELVADLSAKNFLKLIRDQRNQVYYKQIKLYQQLQFLDAMINTFRSLRITAIMNNYSGFVKKISCIFPITFNLRFYEQFSSVKQKIIYFDEQALQLKKTYETDNESLKYDEQNLEYEYKEFRNQFKENILSFKTHVNHYSYQNIIFYTILKLIYQNYSLNEEFVGNFHNYQDVLRLISLTINNIDINLIDMKVLEKYDMKALEVFSSLSGSLVMLTQILQIFMKEPRIINYMILNSLQKEGSLGKIVEVAKKFIEIWQQVELKSLQKNSKDIEEMYNMSKDTQNLYKKLTTVLSTCIDNCLETINNKLEYFFKMITLQIQFTLQFNKNQNDDYREDIKQGIYGWHYQQIKSQQMILKQIKSPSKNKYYSLLIEFLITHIELQLLPRYQNTKKFIETDKIEKLDASSQLSEEDINQLDLVLENQNKEFYLFALKEYKKERISQYSMNIDINSLIDFILDRNDFLQKQFQEQSDPQTESSNMNELGLVDETDSSINIAKMKKDDFYSKVKEDAEEMCSYLLRELFCFKNHSDQILALLLRKEQSEVEFIKSTISKIKEVQQQEKAKASAMEIEENKTEEPSQKLSKGQSGSLINNRSPENQGASSIPIQHGGENNSINHLLSFSQLIRDIHSENNQNNSSNGLQTERLRSIFDPHVFGEQQRLRSNSNRYQLGRNRQGQNDNSLQIGNTSAGWMQGQKQDKELSKVESITQFKQLISNWENDYLVNKLQQINENHNRISYVIYATMNLIVSRMFKDFKFKNPFKSSKETIQKLRNNELLHVPSKQLENSNVYKLELINTLIPFAEKFGFYNYKEISTEESSLGQNQQTSQSSQNQIIHKNNEVLNNKQNSSAFEEQNEQFVSSKIQTIKLLNQEDLDLKWKEGNESYQIGIEFIRLAKYIFTNGQNVFNTPKKGEDKENYKQSSFDSMILFVKNQCHLIQKINQMNQKFKQKLKKESEQASIEEKIILEMKKSSTQPFLQEKQGVLKASLNAIIASNDQSSNKMIQEEMDISKNNSVEVKRKKNKNKRKNKNKKLKKEQVKQEVQKEQEAPFNKTKSNPKGSPSKPNNIISENSEEKKIQEKIKQIKESQNLIDEFEKEVILMFVNLIHFNNEQQDYYGQSLISITILTFILDTIKQYSESNKQLINLFISEKGFVELLKIKSQTDQVDLLLEKLNIFMTNITQDPIMALSNYESKIKYFFYEKCIHQQTLMYQINHPYLSKKIDKNSKKDLLKKQNNESTFKKSNSTNKKTTKEEQVFTPVQLNEQSGFQLRQSPIKQSSSNKKPLSPQTIQKENNLQQQKLNQKLTNTEQKQKQLKVSIEEFNQRFIQFKNISLFQETVSKLCELKTFHVKKKKQKPNNISSKYKQQKKFLLQAQKNFMDLLMNDSSTVNPFSLIENSNNINMNNNEINDNINSFEQSQPNQSSQDQQQQRPSGENPGFTLNSEVQDHEQNQSIAAQSNLKDKKVKNQSNHTYKKKGKNSKSKKKQMVEKQFYILREDINLHQLQLIPNENFLANSQNTIPLVPVPQNNQKQLIENQSGQKQSHFRRSQSASKYSKGSANNQNQNLFKQKSEDQKPNSIKSEHNLNEEQYNQLNKNNCQSQNNFNQMINFVAPTQIYETLNQILENIVVQFTKKILQNYDLIHKKNPQKKPQQEQNEEYLFNNIILLKVIQIIARQQAVLVPQIVRFRCSKIVKKLIQGHPLESVFQKQLGSHFHFLKFITKCANYFSISQVKGLIFELCLDKQILYEYCHNPNSQGNQQTSNNKGVNNISSNNLYQNQTYQSPQTNNQYSKIIPFGAEIRKKVLGEIYSSIENELSNDQNILQKPHTIHLVISNILLHLNLLNIREVAKLSLRNITNDITQLFENQPQQSALINGMGQDYLKENIDNAHLDTNGYNFAKLYGEILKKFDISKMSWMQNVIVFVTSILEMLYILNYYFILYPSGISGNKNEKKKKNDDYMSKFIQSQILTQQFQKHIKQYAHNQGNFNQSHQDQFGHQRNQFNLPFNREFGQNPINILSRNLLDMDPFNALSRFTSSFPNSLNFSNHPQGQNNASLRVNLNREQNLIDALLNNHLGRNQMGNTSVQRSTQNRFNRNNIENLFRRIDENNNGNTNNQRNRDEDADNLLIGRNHDDEEDDEDEVEDDDDDQIDGNFDESLEEDDEEQDEENDDEEDEDNNSEEEEVEDDEEIEDLEVEEHEIEEEDDIDEDEDNESEYNNFVINRNRQRGNQEAFNIQRNDEDQNRNNNFSARRRQIHSIRNTSGNRFDENGGQGSQQSLDDEQEVEQEIDDASDEEMPESIVDNEEADINQDHNPDEEDIEGDDECEDMIYLNQFLDGDQSIVDQNNIEQLNGEGDEDNQDHYEVVDNEEEDDDDDDDENDSEQEDEIREGSYYNEDWEDYSSGDEISEVGGEDEMSAEEYYDENSGEQEVDVRDREDDDEEEDHENNDEEGQINIENHGEDDEEEEENPQGLISEQESNVWNDHEFSDNEQNQDDYVNEENINDEEEDEEEIDDELFDNHAHVIDINNLVNQVESDDDADEDLNDNVEDESQEDEDRSDEIYEVDIDDNEDLDQNERILNNQNSQRSQDNENEDIYEDNDEINNLENDDEENLIINPNFETNRSVRQQQQRELRKLKSKINEDPDCRKQLNAKEITEFSNITMSECLKDTYKRCQQLIQVHYIGTSQQNIAYHAYLKEIQREVALIEHQYQNIKEQDENKQQIQQNISPKMELNLYLTNEQINKSLDKSVYIALLIFYKYTHFDSTYNKSSRNIYAQNNPQQDNQGNNSNQNQQVISNAQMVSSIYMVVDRRNNSATQNQNGDLSRAQQYRFSMRMPPPMSSYNRNIQNRHQSQSRPQYDTQEADIPGSSLNELIQHIQISNSQRPSSSSTLSNLNQLIRGNFQSIGGSIGGFSNLNQLVRQNSLLGHPQLFTSSSYIGGSQRALQSGRFQQNSNIQPQEAIQSSDQPNRSNHNNMRNGQQNNEIQLNVSSQNQNQQTRANHAVLTEMTQNNQASDEQQNIQINMGENNTNISEARSNIQQESLRLPPQANVSHLETSSNLTSSNIDQINQIVNGINSLAPLFLSFENSRSNSQQSRNNIFNLVENLFTTQPRQLQEQSNSRTNNQLPETTNIQSGTTNSNSNQVNQLVSELTSIAPLLITTLENTSQQNNQIINFENNNNPSSSMSVQIQQDSNIDSQEQNIEQSSRNLNERTQQEQQVHNNQESHLEMSNQQIQTQQTQEASNHLPNQGSSSQQQSSRSNTQNVQSQPNLSQNSIIVLSRLNLDSSFLTRNGLDFQYFDELPDDIKEELIFSYLQDADNFNQNIDQYASNQQNEQQVQQIQNDLSLGQNTLNGANSINQQPTNLPNVVENNQGSQPNTLARNIENQPNNNPSPALQINQANVDLVNSSDPNLRIDILLQSNEEFLSSLTQEMQDEARRLRQNQGLSNNVNLNTFRELTRQRVNQTQPQNQMVNQMVNEIFKNTNSKGQKKQLRIIDDWINKDQFIYKKLIETDDKFTESVLRLIYYGGKQPNIFPLQLLELICKNPSVEQKVFDSLMFILMNPNMSEIKRSYLRDKNKSQMQDEKELVLKENDQIDEDVFGFPLLNTYHKNSKETDYKKVYSDVSLKILRIIQKLTMKRVLFFIDNESIAKNNMIDAQSLIQIEKEKGNFSSIKELKKYANEINSFLYDKKSFSLPYFQFIYLLTQEPFRSNYEHLNYLLCSIQNITKKLFQFHSGKQEIEEDTLTNINDVFGGLGQFSNINVQNKNKEDQDKDIYNGVSKHSVFSNDNSFLLHPDVIRWICSIFSSECLNEILIRKLSLIINQLCYDKNNLDMFINELRNIIKIFSIQINKQVVKCLQSIKKLDKNSPSFSSQLKIHLSQLEFSISGEKKIQKIFQIIYELFEKSFSLLEEESKRKECSSQNQSTSKNDMSHPETGQNNIEMEEEEEKKDNQQINTNSNINMTYGNRRTSTSGQEEIQHRNRGIGMVSDSGANKTSSKKQNVSQKILKEQERLESIKKEIRNKFSEIISHQNFNDLWINCAELFSILGKYEPHNLSSFNSVIEKLQPVMESYFIIFRIMHDEDFEFFKKGQTQKKSQQQKQISSLADDEIIGITSEFSSLNFETLKGNIKDFDIQQIFKFICEQCKVVINQMIRQNLKQKKSQNSKKMNDILQKDPFEIIFKRSPNLIDFENKKNYFKYEMQNMKVSIPSSQQRRRKINVRRKHIFEDSFQQIDQMRSEELKQKFIIEFEGEEGIDAGGLIREWFIVLSKAIFNPDYLLFKPSSSGNTYQPNKSSYLNDPHLQYFKFVGRVVGKALFEGQLLDAYFTRSFYKHILGQPLTYHDIEDQDYEFYKSLKWVMENDISNMTDLTFSYEENEFDILQTIELKPGGRSITVTEENKHEYVKLICYEKMAKNIKAQIENFLEGFHQLIPYDLVKIFDSHELELMISGLPDIDIMDLRENTEYQNYTSNTKIIEWFWEILDEFDNTQRASFLQFVTGTSKVPVEGFKGLRGISGLQKFQIHKSYDPKKLPIAHTCFNQLDIPEYPTKEILKKKLLMAISEGKEGFGFA